MADYLPQISSNWTTATWITAFSNLTAFAGTPPMSADDVYADGKTIVIDTNIHVATLRTTTAPRTGGVAGGGFRATNNTSLTANLWPGTTTCLTFVSASPNSFTLFGNVSGLAGAAGLNNSSTGTANIFGFVRGSNNNANLGGITNTGSGTVNIVGDILGGSLAQTGGVFINSGVLNITGRLLGTIPSSEGSSVWLGGNCVVNLSGNIEFTTSRSNTNNGINAIQSSASVINMIGNIVKPINLVTGVGISLNTNTLNMTGNITQGGDGTNTQNIGVLVTGGTVNLVGNINGGAGNSTGGNANDGGIVISSGTVNVIGNVTGGVVGTNSANPGISSTGTATINVTGNVMGGFVGSSTRNSGIRQASTGNIRVVGSAMGRNSFGIANEGAGFVYVTRVIGASGGPTNPSAGTDPGISNGQNGLVYVEEIQYGAQGATPVSGPVFMVNRQNTVLVMEGPPPTFTETTLFGNLNVPNLFPPVSSVRSGITYGNGDFTGTMVVPPPQAVQVGVPVDNTVGTFVLSPESFWTIQRSNSAFNDPTTIGYRIKNLATIPSVGSLIGSFNLYPPQSAFNIL